MRFFSYTLLLFVCQLYEHKYTYDKGSSSVCHIEEPNEGLQCEVSITIDQDVDGPLYFYYELTNFYQNHRRYYMSRSIGQLQGERLGKSDVALDCSPLVQNGSLLLNPCGLVANSYFNGKIRWPVYVCIGIFKSPFANQQLNVSLSEPPM